MMMYTVVLKLACSIAYLLHEVLAVVSRKAGVGPALPGQRMMMPHWQIPPLPRYLTKKTHLQLEEQSEREREREREINIQCRLGKHSAFTFVYTYVHVYTHK